MFKGRQKSHTLGMQSAECIDINMGRKEGNEVSLPP
jgi:hypothetical protein